MTTTATEPNQHLSTMKIRKQINFFICFCAALFSITDLYAQPTFYVQEPDKFFISPNTSSTLEWQFLSGTVSAGDLDYVISDVNGNQTGSGTATTSGTYVRATVSLPRGYHQISFPALGKTNGIAVSPIIGDDYDPYFCFHIRFFPPHRIAPWNTIERVRIRKESQARMLAKMGVRTVRDRITPAPVHKSLDVFDWTANGLDYEIARVGLEKAGIQLMSFTGDTPGWQIDEAPHNYTSEMDRRYTDNYLALYKSWFELGKHWGTAFHGRDTYNEPLPGYETLLANHIEAMRHAATDANFLLGGFGYTRTGTNKGVLDAYIQSGTFKKLDFWSWHDYNDPGASSILLMETYRAAAVEAGTPNIPMYITEIGRSTRWRTPTISQTFDLDAGKVANAVTMKAHGLSKIFMFIYDVLPIFPPEDGVATQNSHRFQTTDFEGTPLLFISVYATANELLRNKTYRGDLKNKPSWISYAHIFDFNETESIISIYSRNGQTLNLGRTIKRAYGQDGRVLPAGGTSISISDNLTYLVISKADADPILDTTSPGAASALKLYAYGQNANQHKAAPPEPIVAQFFDNFKYYSFTPDGYKINNNTDIFPLEFQLHSFLPEDATTKVTLKLPPWLQLQENGEKTFTVPGRTPDCNTAKKINWQVRYNPAAEGFKGAIRLIFSGDKTFTKTSEVYARVIAPRTASEMKQMFMAHQKIDDISSNRWRIVNRTDCNPTISNISPEGVRFTMNSTGFVGGRTTVAFTGLDPKIAENYTGIFIRGRAPVQQADNFMIFDARMSFSETNGGEFSDGSVLTNTGVENWAYVAFDKVSIIGGQDDNNELDVDRLDQLRIFMNRGVDRWLEIYEIAYVTYTDGSTDK